MNDEQWAKGWAVLTAVWFKETPPPATIAIYRRVLDHLNGGQWEGAVYWCLEHCTFFPKPAELILGAIETVKATAGLSDAWARAALAEQLAVPRLEQPQ